MFVFTTKIIGTCTTTNDKNDAKMTIFSLFATANTKLITVCPSYSNVLINPSRSLPLAISWITAIWEAACIDIEKRKHTLHP
jgi:hypothetical protein